MIRTLKKAIMHCAESCIYVDYKRKKEAISNDKKYYGA